MYNLNGNIYKIVWNDGSINTLICNNTWKIEGQKKTFETLEKLERYYEGRIKTFERIN